MEKRLNRKLTEKEIQILLQHLQRSFTSVITRKMQIKLSLRQHFLFYQAVKNPKVCGYILLGKPGIIGILIHY